MGDKSSKELLKNFIYKNAELEKLESMINEFNIFSSLNIIRREIRHSDFLSWLLNPQETHGIGDYFLKLCLKDICYKNEGQELSIFDIDSANFNSSIVFREWHNIDILIVDDNSKIVCVIENKIDSTEHSNQLIRYKRIIEKEFYNYKKSYVYLTKDKEVPSEESYIAYGYEDIVNVLKKLIDNRNVKINEKILFLINDYIEIVRRYIMENSEIQEICRTIYNQHKKALDLIFQYKPDIQSETSEFIVELLREQSEIIQLDDYSKSAIFFIPKEIDFVPKKCNRSWRSSNRILLFEIRNFSKPQNRIDLNLFIGPCEQYIKDILFETAQKHKDTFNISSRQTAVWSCIYRKKLIDIKKYEELDVPIEAIKKDLSEKMNRFFQTDMKKIISALIECKDNEQLYL